MNAQLTGNAALFHVARELSRRGWHAMPTIRNAKGSDLLVTNDDETVQFGVQSKGISGAAKTIQLGQDLSKLRSSWWIITIHAMAEAPVCYILSLDEVKANATQDGNGCWWLMNARGARSKYRHLSYQQDEFCEAWNRLGTEL